MYQKIMVPVDLEHAEKLENAFKVSADIARIYGANVCYVGVTTEAPSSVARNPQEFAEKLDLLASKLGEATGVETYARSYASHDPATDLNKTLLGAIDDVEADLVVMGSHVPGFADMLSGSHGSNIASHASCSVFVVR